MVDVTLEHVLYAKLQYDEVDAVNALAGPTEEGTHPEFMNVLVYSVSNDVTKLTIIWDVLYMAGFHFVPGLGLGPDVVDGKAQPRVLM